MLGELCDRYGMDSISVSNTIGLVFTLFEMGAIPKEAAGDLTLKWGDADCIEQLLHKTLQREGIGKWIAEGAAALGRHFGKEQEAVQVNGLEVPYHDPRGSSEWQLFMPLLRAVLATINPTTL